MVYKVNVKSYWSLTIEHQGDSFKGQVINDCLYVFNTKDVSVLYHFHVGTLLAKVTQFGASAKSPKFKLVIICVKVDV